MSALLLALLVWLAAWALNVWLAGSPVAKTRLGQALVPLIFGATLLVLWEGLVRGLGIAPVILPAPSAIAAKIATSVPVLWADFAQTILKGAIPGFLIGSAIRHARFRCNGRLRSRVHHDSHA